MSTTLTKTTMLSKTLLCIIQGESLIALLGNIFAMEL
jgi:hypothetical protein